MLSIITGVLLSIWSVLLDTAFWLLLGLSMAALVRVFISQEKMSRWLGGDGAGSVFKATLLGAPLPLCSCGVLPAAIGLRRAGASKPATLAFLISTPETGVDSISVSYALLGPFMAIVRPVAAIVTALSTGLMAVLLLPKGEAATAPLAEEKSACCANKTKDVIDKTLAAKNPRLKESLHFAFVDLLDDLVKWLVVGIVLAGVMLYFVPPNALAQWGSGFGLMVIMLLVGIPLYICATASTPVAAALLVAGVSPGAVLVFMLAGPATNIAGMGIVYKELGKPALLIYLLCIATMSLLFGLLTNYLIDYWGINLTAQMGHAHIIPEWLAVGSAIFLIVQSIRPVRNFIYRLFFVR